MVTGNKKLACYLKRTVSEYEMDEDMTRLLRRLHIKKVHLKRRKDNTGLVAVKRMRDYLEV